MKVVADLHIHSRFARAVSKSMTIPVLNEWAKKKGIDLVATGDWTHPVWFKELQRDLVEIEDGIYETRKDKGGTKFLLSTEISSIYSQGGKTRRIHTLIFAPSFETAERINKKLVAKGANLISDGRPIIGLSAKELAELVLNIDEKSLIIPAHIWTPWFSMYGSMSGFDSIEECFGSYSKYIYAVESGLSSDPAMNWRIEDLENRKILSFSDAHSPAKLGREVVVFDLTKISFNNIRKAIKGNKSQKIAHTIEFYPEEGKYHYTGHRKCKVVYSPKETKKKGFLCPVCVKKLTVGVMSRVEALAEQDVETKSKVDKEGVRWIKLGKQKRPPFVMLVPLAEVLSEALETGVGTKTVNNAYESLVSEFENEFNILLKVPIEKIANVGQDRVADAIKRVRAGDIMIKPGYDGVFGEVRVWKNIEKVSPITTSQDTLF